MKQQFWKRTASLILSVCVASSLLPMAAFAVEPTAFDLADGGVTITSPGEYTITQSSTGWTTNSIVVNTSGAVNITLMGIRIRTEQCAFSIQSGSVTINLQGENRLSSGDDYAGLQNNINSLAINGPGTLFASSALNGAGIGGGNGQAGRNITINGGTISAGVVNNGNGAGIGGGNNGDGGTITITGGRVYASSFAGAGIGGGASGEGNPDVHDCTLIEGGTITAKTTFGACIGGGKGDLGFRTIIDGGSVITEVVDPGFSDPKPTLGNHIGGGAGSGYGSESATNNAGKPVNPTLISGLDANRKMEISVASPNNYYGTRDIYSDTNGNICLMLPAGEARVTVGSNTYTGTVANGTSNNLICENVQTDGVIDLSVGSVAIDSTGFNQSGKRYSFTGDYTIYQSANTRPTSNTIIVSGGSHNVTLDSINIDVSTSENASAIETTSDVTMSLVGTNTLKSGSYGLNNSTGNLIIEGSGKLQAEGGRDSSGIRSGSGSLTINSGTIIAIGGLGGAGIGAGSGGTAKNITINGGMINATGGSAGAAGIGGGGKVILSGGGSISGCAENITINGGTITATGSDGGAGIGGGNEGSASNIVINGGSISASGENAIGGGNGQPAFVPKNTSGSVVYLLKKTSLTDAEKGFLSGISYGLKDVNAIQGEYYLYIPRYSITYQNATDATNSNVDTYTVLDELLLADASKMGFIFDGWFDANSGGNKVTKIPQGSSENKTLYARWSTEPTGTAPTITGPETMTLTEGYAATETGAYTITGTEPITVTKTSGNANISWNDTTKKLEIAAGLTEGSYPVTLTASNGTSPDAALTFTLTVSKVTHTHTYGTEWQSDAANHWHECTAGDGARDSQAAHTAGDWIVDTQPTKTEAGSQHKECTVCGYTTVTEVIPATGGGSHDDDDDSGGRGGSSSGGGSIVVTPPTPEKPNNPTNATNPVPSTVKDGTATVTIPDSKITDAIKAAQDAAKKDGTTGNGISVTIKATGNEKAGSVQATLSASALKALTDAGVKTFTIECAPLTVTLDLGALKTLTAAGGEVKITATKQDNTKLPTEAKTAIGSRPVYQLTATAGGKTVKEFGGQISVAIPYTPATGEIPGNLYGVYVDDSGKVTWLMDSSYDGNAKMLRFATSHFSVFGIGYKANTPAFTDIANHWAKADIEFVAARGLLIGTGKTTFSPDGFMTRGMFVTALGRLAGIDSARYKNTKFTDVAATAYYAPYVAWAAEMGITSGTSTTTFSPDKTITRQELATLMVNYAKAMKYTLPKTREAISFADSDAIGSWARDAVNAMQMAGVMNGKNENKFDPTGTATRAEVAAVLRRYVELVIDPATAQGLDKKFAIPAQNQDFAFVLLLAKFNLDTLLCVKINRTTDNSGVFSISNCKFAIESKDVPPKARITVLISEMGAFYWTLSS